MSYSYLILSFIVEEIQAVINDVEDNKKEERRTTVKLAPRRKPT